MPKVLFTLLKSPYETNELRFMERVAEGNEKGVMLFEDAIYYATIEQFRNELLNQNFLIYVIGEELEARGQGKPHAEGVEIIDYDTAVDILMEKYDKVVSL